MNCLCCGRSFSKTSSKLERNVYGWHLSCIRNFFGTDTLPEITLSEETLRQLAIESINQGYTVPGVQKKLSLHLTAGEEPRLTLVNYPTGYILKPQTQEYTALPEAEYLVMQMAKATGIKTVPFALIRLSPQENSRAYITKRIDRISTENNETQMLAMEDFCQLEDRLTQDKYRGSYERCAKVISRYSSQKLLDLTELFLRIAFSFAIGNSDMHLKNFSLIEDHFCSGSYILSAAYDMLPVNVVLPEDQEQLALTMNGKKRNIRKKDFLAFAETAGLPGRSAQKLLNKIVSMEETYIAMCGKSLIPDDMKDAFCQLISRRIAVLK